MRGTQIRSFGQEGSLEKELATHSSMLAWKISWTVEPGIARQAPLSWILQARILEWVFRCYKLTLLLVPSKF